MVQNELLELADAVVAGEHVINGSFFTVLHDFK